MSEFPAKLGQPHHAGPSDLPGAASLAAALVLHACWAFLSITRGERLTVHDGFGWDGLIYGYLAQDFHHTLTHIPEASSRLDRLLPSLLVNQLWQVLGWTPHASHIVLLFQCLTAFMLAGVVITWWLMAKQMRLSTRQYAFGAGALLVNFMNLKHAYFYAVLVDSSALLLAMLCTLGFVSRQRWLIFLSGILATFTMASVSYLACLLLLWPAGRATDADTDAHANAPAKLRMFSKRAWAGITAIILLITAASVLLGRIELRLMQEQPWWNWMPLAAVLWAGLQGAAVARWWAVAVPTLQLNLLRRVQWPWMLAMLVVLAGAALGQRLLASADLAPSTMAMLLSSSDSIFFRSVSKPLISLAAHVTYTGPWVLWLLLSFRKVTAKAATLGPSSLLVLGIAVVLASTSETRHLIPFLPLLVLLTAAAVPDATLTPSGLGGFAAMQLAWSKIWLPLNQAHATLPPQLIEARYYLNFGPWMPAEPYAWTLALAVLSLAWCWWQSSPGMARPGSRLRSTANWLLAAVTLLAMPLLHAKLTPAASGSVSPATADRIEGVGEGRQLFLANGTMRITLANWPTLGSPRADKLVVCFFDYAAAEDRALLRLLADEVQRFGDQLAVVLVPTPRDASCNPYVPSNPAASSGVSCSLARTMLGLWLHDREMFYIVHHRLVQKRKAISAPDLLAIHPALAGTQPSLEQDPLVSKRLAVACEWFGTWQQGDKPVLAWPGFMTAGKPPVLRLHTTLAEELRLDPLRPPTPGLE